jgi:hypothetical protein
MRAVKFGGFEIISSGLVSKRRLVLEPPQVRIECMGFEL